MWLVKQNMVEKDIVLDHKKVFCPVDMFQVSSDSKSLPQMRFAGVIWQGFRFAGTIFNLYYDTTMGHYMLCMDGGLKFQIYLLMKDLIFYRMMFSNGIPLEMTLGFSCGEPLYSFDWLFFHMSKGIFHFPAEDMSCLVNSSNCGALVSSVDDIEGSAFKNWGNKLLDSFAISGRFMSFVDSELFYKKIFSNSLKEFTSNFIFLLKSSFLDSIFRLWVLYCLLLLDSMNLLVSSLQTTKNMFSSLQKMGSSWVSWQKTWLLNASFSDRSIIFVCELYFLDMLLDSLSAYMCSLRLFSTNFNMVRMRTLLGKASSRGRVKFRRQGGIKSPKVGLKKTSDSSSSELTKERKKSMEVNLKKQSSKRYVMME